MVDPRPNRRLDRGMKFTILALTVLILSSGCSYRTKAKELNRIQIGMTKNEVYTTLGEPIYSSAKGSSVLYHYSLFEEVRGLFGGIKRDYYVRLVNGRVESYGKLGDFDSTKDPTLNLNIKNR